MLNYGDNGNIQQIFSHNENTPLCYPYGTQTFTVDQGAQVQMDVCNVNVSIEYSITTNQIAKNYYILYLVGWAAQ